MENDILFSWPSILLLLGLALVAAAQIAIFLHAVTGSLVKGLLCLLVPFYVFVYVRKRNVNPWFMRIWWLGIALFVVGAVMFV